MVVLVVDDAEHAVGLLHAFVLVGHGQEVVFVSVELHSLLRILPSSQISTALQAQTRQLNVHHDLTTRDWHLLVLLKLKSNLPLFFKMILIDVCGCDR